MTKKKIIIYCIVAFWLFASMQFFVREIMPRLTGPGIVGYSGIFTYAQGTPQYTMEIFRVRDGSYLGKVQTVLQLQNGDCEISTQVEMDFDSAGMGRVEADFRTLVSPNNSIKALSFYCHSALLNCRGVSRTDGDNLILSTTMGNEKMEVTIPRREMVVSDFMGIGALPNLHVGQILQFRSLDLLSLRPGARPTVSTVEARVDRWTTVIIRERPYEVFELQIMGPLPMRAYVNKRGDILKYDIPGMLTMIRRPLPGEPDVPTPEHTKPAATIRPGTTQPASTRPGGVINILRPFLPAGI